MILIFFIIFLILKSKLFGMSKSGDSAMETRKASDTPMSGKALPVVVEWMSDAIMSCARGGLGSNEPRQLLDPIIHLA